MADDGWEERQKRSEAREIERHLAEMRAYEDERRGREACERQEERRLALIERDVVAHERRADAEELRHLGETLKRER